MDAIELYVNGNKVFSNVTTIPMPVPPVDTDPVQLPPTPVQPVYTDPVQLPPTPVPQPLPVGCGIQDINYPPGTAHMHGADRKMLDASGSRAFRVPARYFGSKSDGPTRYGVVQFYELSCRAEYCISAHPCSYDNAFSATLDPIGVIDLNYVTADSPSAPSGYKQLPPLPPGQDHYYVNVRHVAGDTTAFFLAFL